tara:strand:+ start:1527 stop:3284 length:1758 start_codon:yes stop_codon:yes gene_type:complete
MKPISILIFILINLPIQAQLNFSQPDFFRNKRELPLINMNIDLNVRITDFGAIPNDGKDDGIAFQRALEYCKKSTSAGKKVQLSLKKGTYDLFKGANGNHLIELKKAKNIIISGNASEIIIHNPQKGFLSIFGCENIIVKDLYIDYDPLPFTQGKIVAIDNKNKTFDFKIDKGFPNVNEQMFENSPEVWGMLMDPKTPGKLKDGAPSLYPSKDWVKVTKGIFRASLKSPKHLNSMSVGDLYVHIARYNGKTIFKSSISKNITFLKVTSYTSPAGSYAAFNMKEWNIIGCEIRIKEGRIHSANADCVHVSGSTFGPWIEHCLFEGYSDDAINLKHTKRSILKQVSATELILKYNVVKGDIIKIYNPREGILIGTSKVLKSKNLGNAQTQVTLETPINEKLKIGETKRHDIAYLDTQSCESFVIRNNTFRNARRYGMLLQSSYGIVEKNVFENLSQCAISMNNGVDWGEGFASHHITINQNIFNNCGYDATYFKDYNAAAIRLRVTKLKNPEAKGKWCGVATTDWQGLKNIKITKNTFSYNKRALSIECSQNVIIKDNMFIHNSKDKSETQEVILNRNNSNLIFQNQ